MSSANHRAERSNERAVEIRIDAHKESVGLLDEFVVGSDFLPRIFESCQFLEISDLFPFGR